MSDSTKFMVDGTTPTLASTDTCVLEVRKMYEVIPSVACVMCFLLGIVYCFCGYRCFKMVMFLSGLAFGMGIGYLLCLRELLLDSPLDPETRAGISLGLGLLGGLVSVLVRSVGLFFTGLHLGLLLSITALMGIGQYFAIYTPVWVPAGTVLGTSVCSAVLTLCWQKGMTMVATATLGSALVMACVDYWIKTPVLVLRAYEGLRTNQQEALCWYGWLIVSIWLVVAALGIFVQRKFTAKGLSQPKAIIPTGKPKQVQLMKIRQAAAYRRPEGKYRRRPPPLKRYAGDVLAPSYLASLREQQMSSESTLSSLSTVYHTMIDFDYETGSMVPLTLPPPTATVHRE